MDLENTIYAIILISFFGYAFYKIGMNVWSYFDHVRFNYKRPLFKDAKIMDIQTEKIHYVKGNAKYRTTVRFYDGFSFISHKTNREELTLVYQISMNSELRRKIIEDAIDAHESFLEVQQNLPKFGAWFVLKFHMMEFAIDSTNE